MNRNELGNPAVQEPQDDLDELESIRSSTVSESGKNVQENQRKSTISPIGTNNRDSTLQGLHQGRLQK